MSRSRLADAVGGGLLLLVAAAVVVSTAVDGAGNRWLAPATLAVGGAGYVTGRVQAALRLPIAGLAAALTLLPLMALPFALSAAPEATPGLREIRTRLCT